METILEKKLYDLVKSFPRIMVAYSGGVDSACLLKVAHEIKGKDVLGVIADSPSLPREELRLALETAQSFGVSVEIIQTREFENPDYLANPSNRCYFCKHSLFERMEALAKERGFPVLAYGENAEDALQIRPGSQAAKEFQVRAPLKEAGLTKEDVRQLSRRLGLPVSDKPASPCLSSRIPHGTPVTVEALSRIEKGEAAIRELGFKIFRLRHHGTLARLEFDPREQELALCEGMKEKIFSAVLSTGYEEVEIDSKGYRSPPAVSRIS